MSALTIAGLLMVSAFSEQDIPGLRVSAPNQLTGQAAFNCLRADFDGNGEQDLLFTDGLVFQQDGRFLTDSKAPLPPASGDVRCDLFGSTIYIRSTGQISAHAWRNGAWVNLFTHDATWPDLADPKSETEGLRFAPFLHDFDEDDHPEVVIPHFAGLHIYELDEDGLTAHPPVAILPPPAEIPREISALWPKSRRRIELAPVRMNCLTLFDGPRVDMVTRSIIHHSRVRFQVTTYTISLRGDSGFYAEPFDVWETEPLPPYLQPVRLNADGIVDFAGGTWAYSEATGLPVPIHDTVATLDRGATVTRRRTRSFSPRCMFSDVNGDGLVDLITETVAFNRGRLKMLLRRQPEGHSLRQTVQVYPQTSSGSFAGKAAITHLFRVRLPGNSLLEEDAADAANASHSINLTGDFNADGRLDSVLRHDSGRLAIYYNQGSRFSSIPDEFLPVPRAWTWSVADVDGDGRADVATHHTAISGGGSAEVCRVFFNKEIPQ
jgi:hypothetical protein